jgi:hypothetical protein
MCWCMNLTLGLHHEPENVPPGELLEFLQKKLQTISVVMAKKNLGAYMVISLKYLFIYSQRDLKSL